MSNTQSLVLFICIGSTCAPIHGQTVHGQTVEEETVESSVVAAVESVRGLEIDSYHRFLREATFIVSTACNHQPWLKVEAALDRQLCPLVSSRQIGNPPNTVGDTLERRYLVREKAVELPGGQWVDASIAVTVRYDNGLDGDPGNAFHARIILVDELKAKTDEAQENRYPKDTVLDLIINSDETKREMERWAYLKMVELSYEEHITRHGVDYGFDATVEFVDSLDDSRAGKRLDFSVPSGLGPANEELPDGFEQRDSLGAVHFYGGTEWGRTIEEAKSDVKDR